MLCVGMDVHKDFTVFDIMDPQAEPKLRHRTKRVPTTEACYRSVLEPFRGKCRIAFEVGTQAQWVASVIRPLAAEVQVANPSRIPWLFRDGRKNDRIDARKLSTLLSLDQLPTVHLPSADVSGWRAMINHRRTLIRRRTMTKNQIRAIVRAFNHRCPQKSLWTRAGRSWLDLQVFDSTRQFMVEGLLAELDMMQSRIAKIEKHLDAIAVQHSGVSLLRTIPGIGPRSAEAIVAFGDQVNRFCRSGQFASYFGMTPTLDASGGFERHGHISKRGPGVVRWLLVEATHRVVRHCPAFRAFFERVRRGIKGRYKKAIVATGRKILTIMFAMMRDGTDFEPMRVSAN